MDEPIDWVEVRRVLVEKFGYSGKGAERAVAKFQRLSAPVASAFLSWWKDGSLPELNVSGYTIEQLITEHGMTPPAAILAMDWLYTDQDLAVEVLERRRYDTIRPHRDVG